MKKLTMAHTTNFNFCIAMVSPLPTASSLFVGKNLEQSFQICSNPCMKYIEIPLSTLAATTHIYGEQIL